MTNEEVMKLLANQQNARARAALVVVQAAAPQLVNVGSITLPYPPSANTLYRSIVRGRRAIPIKSKEHRDYFAAVENVARTVALQPTPAPLEVTLRLFRPRRVGDVDGPIKALLDSLNGLAWEDDSQIEVLHVFRGDDKVNPRVMVEWRAHGHS